MRVTGRVGGASRVGPNLNATLVHKWHRQAEGAKLSLTALDRTTFVRVTMAPAVAPVVDDIRIERCVACWP